MNPIDDYIASLDEPAASTLAALRATLRDLLPDAEEALAYGVPAIKLAGKPVAGFAAFKGHLSYFPHRGDVLARLSDELDGYATSKGTLKFPLDTPLPKALVERLVRARLDELGVP